MTDRETNFLLELDKGMFFDDERKILNNNRINELFHAADLMVNNFGFNRHDVAESIIRDPFRRCIMLHIMLEFIQYWGTKAEEWRTDGRNEMASRFCKEIAEDADFRSIYRFYMDNGGFDYTDPGFKEVAILFVEETKFMHKTLIQTFATLLFELITMFTVSELMNVSEKMCEKYCDDWFVLPLI